MYLELGILRIGTIIKARRINFLHYLVSQKESEMISQVFRIQWNQPCKNDWTLSVKQDLADFGIEVNLSNIKRKSEASFKNYVKLKAYEYEFNQLMNIKWAHSIQDNLCYSRLEMQNYSKLGNLNNYQAQTLFRYRVRMANLIIIIIGKIFAARNKYFCVHYVQYVQNISMASYVIVRIAKLNIS